MRTSVINTFSRFLSYSREFNFRLAGRWLILGILVGIVSGIGAILFQSLLHLTSDLFINHFTGIKVIDPAGEVHKTFFTSGTYRPWLIALIPAAGALISGFIVYRFAPEAEGHGTDEAINAYHHRQGIIKPKVPVVKLIASAIIIGTGGSGGREGPIAQIGAGFGSFLATRLRMDVKTRRWLLAAGMGAGIGSIFRAPLAGAIFAAEVLYSTMEVEAEVLLPATVSSIIAFSVYSFRYGWSHIFSAGGLNGFSNPLELVPYTIEALFLAFAAFIFVKTFYASKELFQNLKIPRYLKPVAGGLITGIFTFTIIELTRGNEFIINVMGSGYGVLQEIFQNGTGKLGIGILLLIGVGKIITTSSTIGSGGSAGVFGPSMVIGGTLGAASGELLQLLFPGIEIHPGTFAVVGMAGFFSAAAKTPLSTIIMVSEMTGNYELLLPSMWVCALSYLVAQKASIYRSQVPGRLFSQAHYDEYAFHLFGTITAAEAMDTSRKYELIPFEMQLADLINLIRKSRSRQRIFPVIRNDNLAGVFRITDLNKFLETGNEKIKTAGDLMYRPVLCIKSGQTIDTAQELMVNNAVEELLVIDRLGKNTKVLGILTSGDILMAYNRKLSDMRKEAFPHSS